MSNTAAHLVDRIIAPDVTVRQWVLSVPFELRLLLAAKPDALSAVGRIFIQEIQRWQRQRDGREGTSSFGEYVNSWKSGPARIALK